MFDPLLLPPCWAFTKALLGRRVPHAVMTSARTLAKKTAFDRMASSLSHSPSPHARRAPPKVFAAGAADSWLPATVLGVQGLLDGLQVLDLAGEPARMATRILADLGASVV